MYKGISTYKTFISEFQCRRPRVRSILKPDYQKAMGKWSNAIFSEGTSKNVLPISRYSYIGPLSMILKQFWPNDLSFGSFEVIWGQIRFLPLTFDRIEIERWEWAQSDSFFRCVFCKDASNDMQYDLFGSTRDLTWPWPEVKFWNYVSSFLSWKVISEKSFLQKSAILTFLDLYNLIRWS